MGGGNSGQLVSYFRKTATRGVEQNYRQVEYVHSYDPRSWSCLHIAEGPFTCSGITIQNSDIGSCGVFQEWADGISLSCSNSIVRNNVISDATDGGIVVFGAPGSLIQNNTISVTNVCIFHPTRA
jgi:parallel beta-helix repeat protein